MIAGSAESRGRVARDIHLGHECFKARDWASSARLAFTVLAQDPSNEEALHLAALVADALSSPDALRALNRLALVSIHNVTHWINLGIAQRKCGQSFSKSFCRALILDPGSSDTLRFHLGARCPADSDVAVLGTWVSRLIRLQRPLPQQAFLDISSAFFMANDVSKALTFLARGVIAQPDSSKLAVQLAKLRSISSGVVDIFFLRARRLAPQDELVRFLFAEALSRWKQDSRSSFSELTAALVCRPDYLAAVHNLGLLSLATEEKRQACLWLKRASVIDPMSVNVSVDLGWALHLIGLHDESNESLMRVIRRAPFDPRPRGVLGSVALELRRMDEAIDLFAQAVILDPARSNHYNKLATTTLAIREMGSEKAEKSLQRALRIDPRSVEALTNYGILLEREGSFEEACEAHRSALSNGSSLQEPKLNLAICQLGLGRFEQAWENYEARWSATSIVLFGRQSLSRKLSTLKPVFEMGSRGRVLLWAEQGVGDEIMFASMIPDLQRSCDELLVEVDSRLLPLFERSFSKVQFVRRFGEIRESIYDYQLPIGSLGRLFRSSLPSFATQPDGYLRVDLTDVERFAKKLTTRAKPLVGVSWWSQNPESGADRSIPLGDLLTAVSGHGVPVNLQYGKQQVAFLREVTERGIEACSVDEIDNQKDLDQLAAMICACDLVISIGNTTAHLAAALGKPTWVLVPLAGSWRWMFQGSTTPWYPSVRLFRRARGEGWKPVLERVTEALSEFSRSRGC